jgi:phosphatidylinositol dimannoside acyltransferase
MVSPVYAGYRLGAAVARALPMHVSRAGTRAALRGFLGDDGPRRRQVERNLRRVLGPDLPRAELDRLTLATFESYARYWIESFKLPALPSGRVDRGFGMEGYHHVAEAIDAGDGAIFVLPHLGGWEWAAFWLSEVMGVEVTAVVEPVEPPELFEWFVGFRESLGMHIVPLGAEAGHAVLRALKAGHVVCLLADRDIAGNGVEVTLFGERTTLPAGPATLALRTGAPIIPAAVYFAAHTGCHAIVRPPLDTTRTGRLRDDVARITQCLAVELEAFVRAAPEQWHLMQPNWPSDRAAEEAVRAGVPVAASGRPQPVAGPTLAPCASD